MKEKVSSLYEFINSDGEFHSDCPTSFGPVYFPLVNEAGLLSAITPDLKGDIKLDQHTFLTLPVSYDDLHSSRSSRNFWFRFDSPSQSGKKTGVTWAANGQSPAQRALSRGEEELSLDAGFLWQQVTRKNKKLGIQVSVLNFVPATEDTVEIMRVRFTNLGKKKLTLTGVSAIPFYGRSADNLRDHRHVTSLLHRLQKLPHGLELCPTMSFNERGHLENHTRYFVLGFDQKGRAPEGFFPTVASFTGNEGDLEKPQAILENWKPLSKIEDHHQGQEAMGALQFSPQTINPGQSADFVLILGIEREAKVSNSRGQELAKSVDSLLEKTKAFWKKELSHIEFKTGKTDLNAWLKWVQIQPTLRKIYGCSFLPDFDYGKGGRGWRDLWQDCLALLLSHPSDVREMIVKNFGGVRIDGSNATILNRKGKDVEFIADRNNITRTWMDHGAWPFLTTKLYLDQTGDWDIFLEKVFYFRDAQLWRARKLDSQWINSAESKNETDLTKCCLKTKTGAVYYGTVLEHILVQTLVQFFNVGEHNIIRLEGADWNDGLDMAEERGESVAFTAFYAGNLRSIALLLKQARDKSGWRFLSIAKELLLLLDRTDDQVNYDSIDVKKSRLQHYFEVTEHGLSGDQIDLPIEKVIEDLNAKAMWIEHHLNAQEWVTTKDQTWMNGYYDNEGNRVEGPNETGKVQMTLTGQVFPVMAGVVDDRNIPSIVQAVERHLFDKKLGGYRLNTDFGKGQPELGRAFSFAYGEKENGAVFSHMVVMYANALYQRGFAKEGFKALHSLFQLAANSTKSKIFPGLPEYFNNEGQGRYSYLTGSASWMIYTYLTQVFGVRGEWGDLLIQPKLDPSLFDSKGKAEVKFHFGGSNIHVIFSNSGKVPYETSRVKSAKAVPAVPVVVDSAHSVRILREHIHSHPSITIQIELGA